MLSWEQYEKLEEQIDFIRETLGNNKATNALIAKLKLIKENHHRIITNKDPSLYKVTDEENTEDGDDGEKDEDEIAKWERDITMLVSNFRKGKKIKPMYNHNGGFPTEKLN